MLIVTWMRSGTHDGTLTFACTYNILTSLSVDKHDTY